MGAAQAAEALSAIVAAAMAVAAAILANIWFSSVSARFLTGSEHNSPFSPGATPSDK